MEPNKKYLNQDSSFWANVKFLNQRMGYFEKDSEGNVTPVIPTVKQIVEEFEKEKMSHDRLVIDGKLTDYGQLIIGYLSYRGESLINYVSTHLMDKQDAKELFELMRKELKPSCPLPMNKQKGNKRDFAFLTGLVNMSIESVIGDHECDYDPREITMYTNDGYPFRCLSRRMDGAFPSVLDPIAVWEIKEYYNTTTFGSRVADGVYETQLDGWELMEVNGLLGRGVRHYLIVDDYYTWWEKGRSYLCRLIDIMHMGLVTEVIFGREVVKRIPLLAKEWVKEV